MRFHPDTHNLKPQCAAVKGQNCFLHRRLYRLPVILQGRPTHQRKVQSGSVFVSIVFVFFIVSVYARKDVLLQHPLAKTVK